MTPVSGCGHAYGRVRSIRGALKPCMISSNVRGTVKRTAGLRGRAVPCVVYWQCRKVLETRR